VVKHGLLLLGKNVHYTFKKTGKVFRPKKDEGCNLRYYIMRDFMTYSDPLRLLQ